MLDTQIAEFSATSTATFPISADDPVVPLQAYLVGYADRDPSKKQPLVLQWQVTGSGSLQSQSQPSNEAGSFFNELTLPATVGSSAVVRAKLANSDAEASLGKFVVMSGAPSALNVSLTGEASLRSRGEITATAIVTDKYGNRVEDGTPVNFVVNGDAQFKTIEATTTNGQATANIVGGEYAGNYTLTTSVNNLTQDNAFTIKPFNVDIVSFPNEVLLEQSTQVKIRVTDHAGQAVAGELVKLYATKGMVENTQAVTDANGELTTTLFAGFTPGAAKLSVNVGYSSGTNADFQIKKPASHLQLDVPDQLLVADRNTEGYLDYQRYDGVTLGLPYRISSSLTVSGTPGDAVQVSLGDEQDPNLQPVLALYMNDLEESESGSSYVVADELGLHNGTTKGRSLEVVSDGVHAGIGHAYVFDGSDTIKINADSNLLLSSGTAIKLEVKPQDAGTLADLGNGQVLRYSNNKIEYSVTTNSGTAVIISQTLMRNVWHRVMARFKDGQLNLIVDDQSAVPVSLSGAVTYSGNEITVGQNFSGVMDTFEIYDYSKQALLAFEDGATSKSVVIGTSGITTVNYKSQGRFNTHIGESKQRIHRVAIRTGEARFFANLISSRQYAEWGGVYASTIYEGNVPAYDVADLRILPTKPSLPSFQFISPAYADFGFPLDADTFISGFVEAASIFIPLKDIQVVGEQLYYLAFDRSKFDPMEMAVSGLMFATMFPVAKPLAFVVKPVQKFYRRYGNTPFVKAMGSVIGNLIDLAQKRRFEKLATLVPYILIVAEMLEEPDALELMVKSIESPDDLWAWIDYFNLPADGWETDGNPPEVGDIMQPNFSPVDLLIANAYAAPKLPRMKGGAEGLGKSIREAFAKLTAHYRQNPKVLSKSFKTAVEALKETDIKVLRKLVADPKFIATIMAINVRGGVKNLKNFLLGKSDARIHPVMMVAIIAYLEEQIADGALKNVPDIETQINLKYAAAFRDIVGGKMDEESSNDNFEEMLENTLLHEADIVLRGGAHGALFHLQMLAYYCLIGEPIKAIEKPRYVWSYYQHDNSDGNNKNKVLRKDLRYVDIMLGDPIGDFRSPEQWIELKSLKRGASANWSSGGKADWGTWKFAKQRGKQNSGNGSYKYHKQYSLDRIANAVGARPTEKDDIQQRQLIVSSHKWWFQKFKVKNKDGVLQQNPDLGIMPNSENIKYQLSELPSPAVAQKNVLFNVGLSTSSSNASYRKSNDDKVDLASIAQLFEEMVRKKMVPGSDDVIETVRQLLDDGT